MATQGSPIYASEISSYRCMINLLGTGQSDTNARSSSQFTISGNLPFFVVYRLGSGTTGGMAVCGYSAGWKIKKLFENSSSSLNITASGATITLANAAASTHMYCLVCACGMINFATESGTNISYRDLRSSSADMRFAAPGRLISPLGFGWLSKQGNAASGSGQTWTGTLSTGNPRVPVWFFTENGTGTVSSIGGFSYIIGDAKWKGGTFYTNGSNTPTSAVSGDALTITNKASNACHIAFIGGA